MPANRSTAPYLARALRDSSASVGVTTKGPESMT